MSERCLLVVSAHPGDFVWRCGGHRVGRGSGRAGRARSRRPAGSSPRWPRNWH